MTTLADGSASLTAKISVWFIFALLALPNVGSATGTWEDLGHPDAYLNFEAISWGPARLDLFMLQNDGSGAVVHRWWDGSLWHAESLGGVLTSGPTAVSWGTGHLAVFGRGQDGAVWTRSFNGSSWSAWSSLGGQVKSSPNVISTGAGNIELFAHGQYNELWTISHNGSWGAWSNLGGVIRSGISASNWTPGYITVLANGQYVGEIWYRTRSPSGWGGWQLLDGSYSSLVNVATSVGQMHVLAGGSNSRALYRSWNGSSWSSWQDLGGNILLSPRIVSSGPGLVDIFADGAGTAPNWGTWRISFNGSSWSAWENLGAPAGKTPGGRLAVCSWGSGRLDVFVSSPGTDGLSHWYLN